MDKSMIKGVVIGGVAMVVLAAGAIPTYEALTKPKFAQVIGVNDVMETIVTPREECHDVQVHRQAPASDSNRVAGTVIGGVVQKDMQHKNVIATTERRCKTVNDTTQKLVGYDVTYRLGDKEGTLRTSFKPGATLPVKDGQVIATPPGAG